MNATLTASSISSIGQICSTLQRPYGTVRKAIESLGVTPVLVINLVAYYADDDVETIREFLGAEPPRQQLPGELDDAPGDTPQQRAIKQRLRQRYSVGRQSAARPVSF